MIDFLTTFFITVGLIFFLGTVVGVMRFPDFFTRVHAASKGDTLSTALLLVGFAIYNLHHFSLGALLVSTKILAIVLFVAIASPAASHILLCVGHSAGIKPWRKGDHVKDQEVQDNA